MHDHARREEARQQDSEYGCERGIRRECGAAGTLFSDAEAVRGTGISSHLLNEGLRIPARTLKVLAGILDLGGRPNNEKSRRKTKRRD